MKRLFAVVSIVALTVFACGGGADPTTTTAQRGDAAAGETVFLGTCSPCHGTDAHGVEGLGKDLHNNAFVAERTDDEMVAFIDTGRPADDPLNTTGVDMPPRGANEFLTDRDLYDVVAYLRTLD